MTTTYWSLTHEELATKVRSRLRLSSTTTTQNTQISDGINEALIELWNLLHPGGPPFSHTEITFETTAAVRYVDVGAAYRALDVDSLRIAAQNTWLLWMPTLDETRRPDPGDTEQGVPAMFTIGSDPDDRNAMRVYLHPIPNAAYTIAAVAITRPAEIATSTLSDVPDQLHPFLADMATRDCAKNLGLYEAANYWNAIAKQSQARDLPSADPQYAEPMVMRPMRSKFTRHDFQDYAP